jgi:hypothetical protein
MLDNDYDYDNDNDYDNELPRDFCTAPLAGRQHRDHARARMRFAALPDPCCNWAPVAVGLDSVAQGRFGVLYSTSFWSLSQFV